MILSPSVIAKNVDRNRETIARHLRVLTDYGLVECIERGYYRITDDGWTYLDGELDADTLEADPTN